MSVMTKDSLNLSQAEATATESDEVHTLRIRFRKRTRDYRSRWLMNQPDNGLSSHSFDDNVKVGTTYMNLAREQLIPVFGEPFVEEIIRLHFADSIAVTDPQAMEGIPQTRLERNARIFAQRAENLSHIYPYSSDQDDRLLAYYDEIAPQFGMFPHLTDDLYMLAETRKVMIAADQEVAVARWLMRNFHNNVSRPSDPRTEIAKLFLPCSLFYHEQMNLIMSQGLENIQLAVQCCFCSTNEEKLHKLMNSTAWNDPRDLASWLSDSGVEKVIKSFSALYEALGAGVSGETRAESSLLRMAFN